MAKTIKAKIDLSKLFVDSDKKTVVKSNSRAGFFNLDILEATTENLMDTQKPLNVDVFYEMAKIGTANNDTNHKNHYVKRAIKMMMLIKKHNINLLDRNFNDPASTKILQEYLNNKAFKIQLVAEDGKQWEELNVDMTTAFKK